jgi:hypothetical protein
MRGDSEKEDYLGGWRTIVFALRVKLAEPARETTAWWAVVKNWSASALACFFGFNLAGEGARAPSAF